MLAGGVAIGEEAGAFQRDIHPVRRMRQVGGIALGGDVDALAVDDDVLAVDLDGALPGAVDRIALEQAGIVRGAAEIVDRDQLEPAIGPLEDRARDQPADTTEAVDRNFHRHVRIS